MKIKQLAVKYVDKIVLVAMACMFAWAGYQAFFKGSPEKDELWESIPRALETLQRNLRESEPPPLPELGDAQLLDQRYARLPVVQPYRRYVLFRPTPILWGTFHFIQGRSREISIGKVHLLRVLFYDSEHLEVSAPQLIDEDDPSAGSRVKINPLRATDSRGVQLLARDIEGVRYAARIIVYREPPRQLPLPPREVEVSVHRGRALLKMRWDNPDPLPSEAAETVGFWVYRKLAGRPDDTYQLLNEQRPAVPDPRHRRWVEEKLRIGEFAPRYDPAIRGPGEEDDILDAVPVEDARPRRGRTREERLADRPTEEVYADLAYFLDETAEPGETYVYRVVAITADVDGERRKSEPWESEPVPVPSDVEFYLSSVLGDTASFRVRRRDYDLEFTPGEKFWHDVTFRVVPGMPIGWERTVTYRHPVSNRNERKDVDFSTGAILVAAYARAPALDVIDAIVREEVPGGPPTMGRRWDVREIPADHVVVQTRRGRLAKFYRRTPPPAPRRERERRRPTDPREDPEEID